MEKKQVIQVKNKLTPNTRIAGASLLGLKEPLVKLLCSSELLRLISNSQHFQKSAVLKIDKKVTHSGYIRTALQGLSTETMYCT